MFKRLVIRHILVESWKYYWARVLSMDFHDSRVSRRVFVIADEDAENDSAGFAVRFASVR
jgi:hypothetical protein